MAGWETPRLRRRRRRDVQFTVSHHRIISTRIDKHRFPFPPFYGRKFLLTCFEQNRNLKLFNMYLSPIVHPCMMEITPSVLTPCAVVFAGHKCSLRNLEWNGNHHHRLHITATVHFYGFLDSPSERPKRDNPRLTVRSSVRQTDRLCQPHTRNR